MLRQGCRAYLFLRASLPILPILLIIILALLTVDDKLILSVDMFFILNNPFFFSFGSPGPPVNVVVVLPVSANETSLLMADGLETAQGAEGGLRGTSVGSWCREAARGVEAFCKGGAWAWALGGVLVITAEGVVDRLLSPPPVKAFLKRPLKLFFSGSGVGETALDNGDGRAAGVGVLVALAIGPAWRGVTVLTGAGAGEAGALVWP